MPTNTSATGGYLTPVAGSSSIDGDLLDRVFQQMVAGITGIDGTLVRPLWQPKPPRQPEPNVDWAAIGITNLTKAFDPNIKHEPSDNGDLGRDALVTQQALTVLCSIYGPNSMGNMNILDDGLQIEQNKEALRTNSIVFVSRGTIRAVPELINETWVKRYDIELTFSRTITRKYEVQNLVSAQVILDNEQQVIDIEVANE